MARPLLFSLLAAALAALVPVARAGAGCGLPSTCFPYGSAQLPKDLTKPEVPLRDWWCPQAMAYGFQGFSYPLEDGKCSAPSNGFEAMNRDFAQMRRDFGARIVRMYYPVCTNASVFENALRAGVANDMAVIFQVWTNFGIGDVWQDSQQALYDVLEDPRYRDIAPYVVHSADFGSEPVRDGMDGGGEQFVTDLGKFRAKLNSYGIPGGISEDWDRPGIMSRANGTGLGPIGAGVRANSDYVHAHIMPFYHGNVPESQAWPYIKQQLGWYKDTVGLPMMITETQWAWGDNSHYAGKIDVGVPQYTAYWEKYDAECELFRRLNVGWFLHAWDGEGTFDILYDNGSYVIPEWRPRKC